MKGNTLIYILLGLLAVFILYLILKPSSASAKDSNNNPNTYVPPTILSNFTGIVSGSFPLKKGSVGSNVTKLQVWLNNKGASLSPDGAFGNLTLAALQKYTSLSEVSEAYFTQNVGTTTSTSVVGKTAYAAYNGAQVKQTDFKTYDTLYKTAQKGEWLGVVSGIDSGRKIYLLGSDFYVPMAAVTLS